MKQCYMLVEKYTKHSSVENHFQINILYSFVLNIRIVVVLYIEVEMEMFR